MYEVFEKLLKKNGVTPYKVAKATGIATATLSDWKNGRSTPKNDKMQLIANYFGISLNYLLTGKDEVQNAVITSKDDKDIAKDLYTALEHLENSQEGLMFEGEPIDDETRELLKISLENSMRLAKQIAKKYTPNKFKK